MPTVTAGDSVVIVDLNREGVSLHLARNQRRMRSCRTRIDVCATLGSLGRDYQMPEPAAQGPSTIQDVIDAAAEAALAGDLVRVRTTLSLPSDVTDDDARAAALGLHEGARLQGEGRFTDAAERLGSAYAVLERSTDDYLRATVLLATRAAVAKSMLDQGNRGAALQVLDETVQNAGPLRDAFPPLAQLVLALDALSHQVKSAQAFDAEDLDAAAAEAGRALAIYREAERLPGTGDEKFIRHLDVLRTSLMTSMTRGYRAFQLRQPTDLRDVLAGGSDEAAELEKYLDDARMTTQDKGEIKGILALRTALAGVYRLDTGSTGTGGVLARIPEVDRSGLEAAVVTLDEAAEESGPFDDGFAGLARSLRRLVPTIGVSAGGGAMTRGQQAIVLGFAVIIAIVGIALIGGTEIRQNAIAATVLAALVIALVAVTGLLGLVGYDRAVAFVPVAIVPVFTFVKDLAVAIGGGSNTNQGGNSDSENETPTPAGGVGGNTPANDQPPDAGGPAGGGGNTEPDGTGGLPGGNTPPDNGGYGGGNQPPG